MIYVSKDLKEISSTPVDGYFEVDADIYSFSIYDYKIMDNTLVIKSDDELNEDEEFEINSSLYGEIQSLISEKMEQAKNSLAEKYDVPSDQISRYEAKYKLAKECVLIDDYAPFNFEAKLQGTSSEDLARAIISMGDAWYKTINIIYTKLDGLRVKLEGYMQNKTNEEFDEIFNSVKNLNPLIMTDEDLENI